MPIITSSELEYWNRILMIVRTEGVSVIARSKFGGRTYRMADTEVS